MGSLLLAVIFLIFISLGLPDSLLGSGWPVMQVEFNVPSSYVGYVSMTISFMTIISALISPYFIKKFHTKWICVFSIFLTIVGLLGFSFCKEYWMLFIFAIPYGLGAGAIDSSINNYVANNYSGSVMSFLHCFYGIGAVISPNIMSLALKYARWNEGCSWTSFIQIGILVIVLLTLPVWNKVKSKESIEENKEEIESVGIKKTILVPGVIATLISFFAYCSAEATCFLWTSSYFAGQYQSLSSDLIASLGSLIYGGLMVGRLISGFITNKLGDKKMIRIGTILEVIGIILIFLSSIHYAFPIAGFIILGIGMGPIYPSIMHMAPYKFGKKYSASVISLQMASAYIGTTFMPLLFGILQEKLGIWIMPIFLIVFIAINISLIELSNKRAKTLENKEKESA